MKKKSIYLTGNTGMVGQSVVQLLNKKKYKIIVSKNRLDLTNKKKTEDFFKLHKPEIVINLAAKVGGIMSNKNHKIEFLNTNSLIQMNIINCCNKFNVKKLINFGSNCIYPAEINNKISEKDLLEGKLETTNEGYSMAKILGLKLCQFYNEQFKRQFFTLMPANLYGPHDNFYNDDSHVVPALIRKIFMAKKQNHPNVTLWGSGKPIRDFLYVDEISKAVMFFLKKDLSSVIHKKKIHYVNIGSGKGINIKNLAFKIKKLLEYKGNILWDKKISDGHKKKVLDISLSQKLGFKVKENLDKNLKLTIDWYLSRIKSL
jgi:GDP-L-fucose synthase